MSHKLLLAATKLYATLVLASVAPCKPQEGQWERVQNMANAARAAQEEEQ